MNVGWDYDIPSIWKNKSQMFQSSKKDIEQLLGGFNMF